MKNIFMVSVMAMMLPVLTFGATAVKPGATSGKSLKSKTQAIVSDVLIGSLMQGGDEDCPVLVVENSSESCAKFGFVDASLQSSILKSINEMSSVVKISGKWKTRETAEGKKAALFVIEYVATE